MFASQVNCSPLEHLVAKTEDEQRLLESVNLMEDVAARDMYAWWATYEGEIQAYRDAFDDLVCSDPDTLRAQLEAIDLQVQRVSRPEPFPFYQKMTKADSFCIFNTFSTPGLIFLNFRGDYYSRSGMVGEKRKTN